MFCVFGNIVCSFGRDNEYSSEVEFNVIDPYFNFSRTSATVSAYENYTIPFESFGVESVEWATSDPLVSVSDGNLSVFLESGNVTIVAKAKLSNGEMVARTFKLTIVSRRLIIKNSRIAILRFCCFRYERQSFSVLFIINKRRNINTARYRGRNFKVVRFARSPKIGGMNVEPT